MAVFIQPIRMIEAVIHVLRLQQDLKIINQCSTLKLRLYIHCTVRNMNLASDRNVQQH